VIVVFLVSMLFNFSYRGRLRGCSPSRLLAPMVEINRLVCDSHIFSFGRKAHTLLMDEATSELNLRIRMEGLRDDLIVVCGNLKKNGYDFTHLLASLS
jgi:hypothetical protein